MSISSRPVVESGSRTLAERGFVHVPGVLSPEQVAALRADLDGIAASAPPGPYGLIVHDVWSRAPVCRALIEEGMPARVALELTCEPSLLLFQDLLIDKVPGASTTLHWHQDYAYWPLDSSRGVTLWFALDDADEDNGCLRYVPRSHHLGERRATDFSGGAMSIDEALPAIDEARCARDGVSMPVRAGDALAHDPLVWHMSPANRSNRPRRAWSLTFIVPAARWDPGHAAHPFLHILQPTAGAPPRGERFPRIDAE